MKTQCVFVKTQCVFKSVFIFPINLRTARKYFGKATYLRTIFQIRRFLCLPVDRNTYYAITPPWRHHCDHHNHLNHHRPRNYCELHHSYHQQQISVSHYVSTDMLWGSHMNVTLYPPILCTTRLIHYLPPLSMMINLTASTTNVLVFVVDQ